MATPSCWRGRTAAPGAGSCSSDVNDYIRACTGIEATAKDFRTWHATVIAAAALAESDEPGETKASRKRAVSSTMKEVSDFLGNTPTLARTAYVDPRVVEAYERGRTITVRATYDTSTPARLPSSERCSSFSAAPETSRGDDLGTLAGTAGHP